MRVAALLGSLVLSSLTFALCPAMAEQRTGTWEGFYLGGALGGKWTDATWTTSTLRSAIFGSVAPDASSPRDFDVASLRGGAYLGYNWQIRQRWVAGVEVDFGISDKKQETAGIPGCTIGCIGGFPGPEADSASVSAKWDASARLRLGYLITPDALIYGTGGLAWQRMRVSATCQHSAADPFCLQAPGAPFATESDSFTSAGWTIGGGVDWRFAAHWIARAEYRFADFGSDRARLDLSAAGRSDIVDMHLDTKSNIATVGLAYQF